MMVAPAKILSLSRMMVGGLVLWMGLACTGPESEPPTAPPVVPPEAQAPPEPSQPPATAEAPPATDLAVAPPVEPPAPIEKVLLSPETLSLTVGDTQKLEASAVDAQGKPKGDVEITWKSSDARVAVVDREGQVKALSAGTATITAAAEDKTGTAKLQVSLPPIARLEIQPATLSIQAGESQKLQVTAFDTKDQRRDVQITWSSKNPEIASVSQGGEVTARKAGQATIQASGETKTVTAQITVMGPQIAKIEIHPKVTAINEGETKQFEVTVYDKQNKTLKNVDVTWNVKDSAIAGINEQGKVTGKAAGGTLITASAGGVTSNGATLTVREAQKGTASRKPSREELKEKFKNVDPSQLIYLSGITGELAGTGDPTKFAGEAEAAGLAQHPIALELSDLPKDRYGLIDWGTAIKLGKVKPRESLNPNTPPGEVLDLDIVIFAKSKFQPDVIFPHKVHTMWLACENCHDAIFKRKAGGHPEMTMPKIASGQYCGRCHNRVAFPLSDCLRCHTKPKDQPPLDPNPEFRPATATPTTPGK